MPDPDRRGDAQDDHELHHRLGGRRHASCHRASDDRRAYLAAGKPACRAVGRRAVRHSKVPVHLPSGQAARAGTEKERGQAEGKRAVARRRERGSVCCGASPERRDAQARRVPHRRGAGRAGTAQGCRRAQGGGRTPPHRADGEERYPLKLYVKTPCMDGKCHAGGSFIF